MSRLHSLLPLVAVSCAGATVLVPVARAQGSGIVVERRGPPALTVEPGGHATLVFRIGNRTGASRAVGGTLELPVTWRLMVPDELLTVPAHAAELKLLQVALPGSALAGRYVLRYAVRDGEASVLDSTIVDVPRRQRLATAVGDAPRFVVAGSSYHVRFLVRNEGNVAADVELRVSSTARYPVQLDSGTSTLHLVSGEERVVRANVTTDPSLARRLILPVQIEARVTSDSAVHSASVSTMEIVARTTEARSRFRSVPAELAITGGEAGRRVSVELSGQGPLTGDGVTQLSFVGRGPRPEGSFFSGQDEYWLQLANPAYALRIGDQGWRSSRISAAGFSTFGAAGDVAAGPLRIGAYAERDRRSYSFTSGQQYGGSLDFRLASGDSVGLGYYTRHGQDAGNVVSGRTALSPLAGTLFTAEYGSMVAGQRGRAFVATLDGRAERVSVLLRRQQADSAFAATWRGTSYTSASLTLRPAGPVDLLGSVEDFSSEAVSVFSHAARQQVADVGIELGHGTVGAFYRHVRQDNDFRFTRGGARHTQSGRVSIGIPVPRRATLRGELEHGYTVDALSTDRLPFRRWAVRGGISVLGQSIAASVDRLQGTPSYAAVPLDQLSGGVNAQVGLPGATALIIGWSGTRSGGLDRRSFSMIDVGIGRRLSSGQRVEYRSRSYAMGGAQTPFARQSGQQVELSMPLGVPVGLADGTGRVQVSLVDDGTGRPVSGVLLRLADEARITDDQGIAEFTGLSASTYQLEVDREKIGRGRIVEPRTPLPIPLRSDETRRVALRLVGTATVRGGLLLLRTQARPLGQKDTLVVARPLAGVRLTISCSTDTLRTVTGDAGQFALSELHPGQWLLEVDQSGLPANTRLVTPRVALTLRSGDARTLELQVAPLTPPTKIIHDVDLTPGVKPPPVASPVPPPIAAPAAAAAPTRHRFTVGRGDGGLMAIARAMYGDATLWPKIWLANLDLITNPDRLRAGIQLRIPDAAPLTDRERAALDAYRARKGLIP